MFFGLTNSPATFQAMMNHIFQKEIREGWLVVYMDDLLIATKDDLEFPQTMRPTNPPKTVGPRLVSETIQMRIPQTTHRISRSGSRARTSTDGPDESQRSRRLEPPTERKRYTILPRVYRILSILHQRLFEDSTTTDRPHKEKPTVHVWTEKQQLAFERLKTLMCAKPVLRQPDYNKMFTLSTDASGYGVGAVLAQEGLPDPRTNKPRMHPVAYYSSTFTPTERNYDVYERELLAVVKALKNWRPHLAATEQPITILTDHANLLYWKNPKNVNRRVARWLTTLQDYNFVIKHVPGKIHAAADMLSRPQGWTSGHWITKT
jgi:hypothetical protein